MKTSRTFISWLYFMLAGLVAWAASAADNANPPPVVQAPPAAAPAAVPAPPPPIVSAPAPAPVDAPANPAPPVAGSTKRSPADLDKLVAPIALYPDPVVAAILPASAYPVEVVLAARFVRDA